ncbi:MAG: hypothetical protein JWQ33_351, partial [Ramlibacter sp.]|nr:hypothetical protein [Ramlibacter sp.]
MAADLLDAWHAALQRDPVLMAAEAGRKAAGEKRVQGDASFAPVVSAGFGTSADLQNFRSGDTAVQPSATLNGRQVNGGLTVSKPLFDGGRAVTRDQLYLAADQAEVQYVQARQDLAVRVASAYFDVQVAREFLRLARIQKDAIEQQLAFAQKSYEIGQSTIADQNDARARYDNVVAAEVAGRHDLEVKEAALRQLTGLDAASAQPVFPQLEAVAYPPATLDDWIARTQAGNPSVRLVEFGARIAHREIDRYRLRNQPVLSLSAAANSQLQAGTLSASGKRDLTTNTSIGLLLSIPLFDGGMRQSQLRQAMLLEDQQSFTLEAARNDAVLATRQYFTAIRDDAERIHALESARDSAQSSLDSSQIAQRVGVRTII